MASVGIVGGLGPESTIDYYRRIIRAWELKDPSSAPAIVIDSLDVRVALRLIQHDRPAFTEYLMASLRRLAGAGVDFAAISANTPHLVFDALAELSPVPLLSIVEVCAEEARRLALTRAALLGTRFTMEEPFYAEAFARHGIAVVVPNEAERLWVHERYVGELLRGEFRDDTRAQFLSLVERLVQDEAIDGVILGGTELPLLLPEPVIAGLPVLDTTALHVAAIVKRLGTLAPPELIRHPSRHGDGGDIAVLNGIRDRLESAENGGDADYISAMLAEDVVLMVPNEPVCEGKPAAAGFVRDMLAGLLDTFERRIAYVSDEVLVAGALAFDRGHFSFTATRKDDGSATHATGKYLWLYSRGGASGWLLSRMVMSLDDPPMAEGDDEEGEVPSRADAPHPC